MQIHVYIYIFIYVSLKHGPLKTSNSVGCFFMTKKQANQENCLKTSNIMVYLFIFCFFVLHFSATRFEVFRGPCFCITWI